MNSKIAFLISLFVGFSAHAVVLPNATFVPEQCGPQTIDVAHSDSHVMESACIGSIGGTKNRAVRFTLSTDETYLFRVVSQSNLMMALTSGATMTVFRLLGENGETIVMKAIVNHDGSIKSISGDFQKNSYIVPVFQPIFTLQ